MRIYERIALALTGRLYLPEDQCTFDCTLQNLSIGGAGIRCENPPPLRTAVVLYVDGFGRFEASTVHFRNGVLGLAFAAGEARRKRLAEKLAHFVEDGVLESTNLRRHERIPHVSAQHFTRPNGEQCKCRIVDISLQGLSLCTTSRPLIGEVVRIGQTLGRVVRYHTDGIGIEFIAPPPWPKS